YAIDGKRLIFGSEIKALKAARGGIEKRIDPQSLAEYMYFGNSLGVRTLFEAVKRLEPGHWLEFVNDKLTLGRYWNPSSVAQISPSPTVAAAEVRSRFEAAVRRQMVSDVPIGVFLSGGVDSTAVVAAATSVSQSRLDTFTAKFEFANDTRDVVMARKVAEHFNTNHHELHVSTDRLQDVLEEF